MPKKGERTVRVQNLIEHYYDDWKEGLTPLKIADKYKVTDGTMYRYLQEIADAHGVARETLLQYPDKSGERESAENPMKREKADIQELKDDLKNLEETIKKVMVSNNNVMEGLENDAIN